MLRQQIGDQLRTYKRTVKATNQALSDAIERHESVVQLRLQADRGNAGTIFIGDARHQFWQLTAGEALELAVSRLNQVFYRGTAGDSLNILVVSTTGTATPPIGA